MAANPSMATSNLIPGAQRQLKPSCAADDARTDELKIMALRQRIEALLRRIFEGHEEFLGWTPD